MNNLPSNNKEFVLVNVETGVRAPAFDHAKLAAALAKVSTKPVDPKVLPFASIEYSSSDKQVEFDAFGSRWKCELENYGCTRVGESKKSNDDNDTDLSALESDSPLWVGPDEELSPNTESPEPPQQGRGGRGGRGNAPSPTSPDGKWTALIKEGNVYLRELPEGKEVQLSKDGVPSIPYGMLQWSPDSSTVVAWRIDTATPGEVYLVESSPRGGGRAKLFTRPYPLPGDKFTSHELSLFDMCKKSRSVQRWTKSTSVAPGYVGARMANPSRMKRSTAGINAFD